MVGRLTWGHGGPKRRQDGLPCCLPLKATKRVPTSNNTSRPICFECGPCQVSMKQASKQVPVDLVGSRTSPQIQTDRFCRPNLREFPQELTLVSFFRGTPPEWAGFPFPFKTHQEKGHPEPQKNDRPKKLQLFQHVMLAPLGVLFA